MGIPWFVSLPFVEPFPLRLVVEDHHPAPLPHFGPCQEVVRQIEQLLWVPSHRRLERRGDVIVWVGLVVQLLVLVLVLVVVVVEGGDDGPMVLVGFPCWCGVGPLHCWYYW